MKKNLIIHQQGKRLGSKAGEIGWQGHSGQDSELRGFQGVVLLHDCKWIHAKGIRYDSKPVMALVAN